MSRRQMLVGAAAPLLVAAGSWPLPWLGARLILHPRRRRVDRVPPAGSEAVVFSGHGVVLHGWRARACGVRRGTVIYLHGVADNREGGAGVIERFAARGFEVIAYDSRAHGESGGRATTYGFWESQDLRRVLDVLDPGPVVLVGCSLGAAVALQTAAEDRRVSAVVAAESFSDLRRVISDRAPFFFSRKAVDRALTRAEAEGGFRAEAVDPAAAAARIRVPVLLVHGESDTDTPLVHSRRIFEALGGPKRLIRVPGAGHGESLRGAVWEEIEVWIEQAVRPRIG